MRTTPIEIFSLICITLAVVEPIRGGSPPTFPLITSLQDWDFRNISSWSGGGGDRLNITSDSSHPFAGRLFGGAGRKDIEGTRAFGSGYPYGNDSATTIAGRPFPFGLWPLWWGQNFMGSDEYGPGLDPVRPGGLLVVQAVTSTKEFYPDIKPEETYHIVTDRDTNLAIMTSIVTWCHATPQWPQIFKPETSVIKPENVMQYYRASSFALAFTGYNNTWTRNTTTGASLEESSPLPDVATKSDFLGCVKGVIVNALPIVDAPPQQESSLPLILGLVFGIFGLPILAALFAVTRLIYRSCGR